EVDGANSFPWLDDKEIYFVEDRNKDGDADDADEIPFTTQFALNATDNSKFLIGTHFLYESQPPRFDLGQILPEALGGTAPHHDVKTDLKIWGDPVGKKAPVGTKFEVGEVLSLAYGGFFLDGGTPKPNAGAAYAGTARHPPD